MFSTQSRFWLILPLLAFLVFPSQALHYGLFDSTAKEILVAIGWRSVNITWLWFLPLLAIEFFKHPKAKIGFLVAFLGLIFLSAKLTATSFGYATLFLFLSIFILFTENIARLGILRGDRFIIGTLLASLIVLCVFILFPMFSILSAIVYINGKFSLDEAFRTSQQPHLLKVIWQSISVSASVGLLSTFFGLCFALYTTRIAKKTKFISKLFSILPIVTPPFVVGLGVVLLMGRNGTITYFLVEQLGINKNWLYGFNGILLSHTLALTPMAFMIIEGALRFIPANLEEASYSLKSSPSQTFRHILFPLLKPALANSFLITSIQSLSDFSTPFVLGGNYDVLASQIYFYIVGSQPDYTTASTMGMILLAFSLASFFIQYQWLGKRSYQTLAGKGNQTSHLPLASGLKCSVQRNLPLCLPILA